VAFIARYYHRISSDLSPKHPAFGTQFARELVRYRHYSNIQRRVQFISNPPIGDLQDNLVHCQKLSCMHLFFERGRPTTMSFILLLTGSDGIMRRYASQCKPYRRRNRLISGGAVVQVQRDWLRYSRTYVLRTSMLCRISSIFLHSLCMSLVPSKVLTALRHHSR